jgi:hypothetical protein
MADQAVAQQVQEMFDKLLGDKAEAKSYSENPEGWLEDNGAANLDPQAVAECGVGYGSGASASASSGGGVASQPASYSPGVAGVAQAIDPVVYNTYIEDNSITNNIANNGYLDFDQQIVQGDGNVVAGNDLVNTGQIQTGDGLQAGGDIDIDDSAVATGGGDATNTVDNSVDVDQSTNIDVEDSSGVNVNTGDAFGGTGDGGNIVQGAVGGEVSAPDVEIDNGGLEGPVY